jgi:hypothetical protein
LGFSASKVLNEKLSFHGALYGGWIENRSLLGAMPATDDVYAGVGRLSSENGHAGKIWDGLFAVKYTPSDIFAIELGRGKHFWGDGYRSLFLSDNPAAYPYLKLRTKVWHINYSNLFSWQQSMLDISASARKFEDKFTSTHMLSWNIGPRTNVQIFESIIWQSKDSLSNRGYEVNYLNPIIFYRPVEFAQGSADNAIIGLGLSHKVYPGYQLYAQLVIDEFLLEQFRNRNGWWGNKFGVQLGAKAFNAFEVTGLYLQSELNLVRPFTYSHGSPLQNYAHLNEALAHPLGSNFYEALLIGIYEWKGLELRDQLSYTLKGNDEQGRNLGGDIFRSYVDPDRIFGNFIGQGLRDEFFLNSLYVSKVFDKSSDSRIMFGYHLRADFGVESGLHHVFSLMLRSNFGDGFR